MDVKLGNITQALEKEVFQVEQFVQLYLQLDSIIQEIRRTVWQANSYIGACTVTIKHALPGTLFIISHYPKKLEGFSIRNGESFTRVFKVTI